DVAYRFFTTEKRKFIVADTPGHEQYTRNMITGASTADVAVILIDARKGLLTQTYRHRYLVSLVGIPKIVLAITKMDLVAWSPANCDDSDRPPRDVAPRGGLQHTPAFPLGARRGNNLREASPKMPGKGGPALLVFVEGVGLEKPRRERGPLRF